MIIYLVKNMIDLLILYDHEYTQKKLKKKIFIDSFKKKLYIGYYWKPKNAKCHTK